MARPRAFDEAALLDTAGAVFVRNGYEGTSIDDLVRAVRVHRGSLYSAFGSKRGLFLAALRRHAETRLTAPATAVRAEGSDGPPSLADRTDLDLLLVAALERGPHDPEVAAVVREVLSALAAALPEPSRETAPAAAGVPAPVLTLLGGRLLERLHPGSAEGPPHRPTT